MGSTSPLPRTHARALPRSQDQLSSAHRCLVLLFQQLLLHVITLRLPHLQVREQRSRVGAPARRSAGCLAG